MKELIALYKQPSYDQKDIPRIRKIVIDYLTPFGYANIVDEKGNMFLYHPESTCKTLLCAHMDMVKTGEPIDQVVNDNGILFGVDKNFNPTSLGADDKNGVWLCMKAGAESEAKPAILLVAHEEGSPHTIDDWLDENKDKILPAFDICLVMDRQGENEIIYRGSATKYSAVVACQWKKQNPDWVFEKGIMCDADRLIKHIPCINLSIGYYRGHSVFEFTVLDELRDVRDRLLAFLATPEEELYKIDWSVVHELELLNEERRF